MGRGEECRNVYLREMSTLSRSFLGKPVPDSDGFQEKVGRKVHPVFLGAKSFQECQWVSRTSDFSRPMREKGEGFSTLLDCNITYVRKNKTLTGAAHNTLRSQQNTVLAQVPSPRREARACIERLAPRSSQELGAAAGAIRKGT